MSELRELGDISLPFALDEKKNYIYIKDAYRDRDYYCPCCGKMVNTIAIGKDKEYQMTPHYRHYPNQSCTGESLAHWVYKMWLFDKGSQFYVSNSANKNLYTVKSIDIEKTHSTDYGNYRPDITITTTCDKIFFFELNFSNPKRSDDYFCKWSHLNYDVIEVDVKKLLKESLNNKIPTFRLIYSDGICFDDKYNKKDIFANAASKLLARKLEIKRQDMLNCKAIWEKLDWFFDSIKSYKAMKATMDDVLNSFSNIRFEDKEYCFEIIRKITCINDNNAFRKIMNEEFFKELKRLEVMNNDKYKNISCFKIENDKAHRFDFYIDINTNLKVGILETTKYHFRQKYVWKKHHYPFSFYKNFKDVFDDFNDNVAKHIYYVNEINTSIINMFTKNEIEYITKHVIKNTDFSSDLIMTDDKLTDVLQFFKDREDKIKRKARIATITSSCDCANHYLNENNLQYKIKYDKTHEEIVLIYSEFWNDENKIILIDKAECLNLKDKSNEELTEYIKIIFSLHYSKAEKNKISKKVLNVIYDIQQQVNDNDIWICNINHIDINHIQMRIEIRVYHKECRYIYYSPDSLIDIKNNKFNDINLSQFSKSKIEKTFKDSLVTQMVQSLLKLEKLDGINCRDRFLQKEDLNEKITTVLHNEISAR